MVEPLILILIFLGITLFVFVGVELFGKGWESYEERYVQGAEKTLESMYITMPAQNIMYLSLASLVVTALIFLLFSGNFAVGIVMGLVAFSVPQVVIRVMKRRRDRKFAEQLVDGLSTMGNALKAGLSLPQAFEIVHQEMESPIRQEFRLLCQEMRFGVRVEDALGNLHRRMPNPDLALMSAAIGIAQEVGGNLAEVFENISVTIRERHRIEARVRALTAQGKLQGIILCLVPVGIGVILTLFYPAMMMPLFETSIGWIVLAVAAAMLTVGGYVMSRIIAIEV